MTADAVVIQLRAIRADEEEPHLRLAYSRKRYPARRPVNGHSPDCPYPTTSAETCGLCAAERKAAK